MTEPSARAKKRAEKLVEDVFQAGKGDELVRLFEYESYRIWNIAAHFSEISSRPGEPMIPPARPDAATWAKVLGRLHYFGCDTRYGASCADECETLRQQLLTLHAQAVQAERERIATELGVYASYLGQADG